jgi:hypothetical protein
MMGRKVEMHHVQSNTTTFDSRHSQLATMIVTRVTARSFGVRQTMGLGA